jgi:hypothetical protein
VSTAELDIKVLREQVDVLERREQVAQRALLAISNISPTKYIKEPARPNGLSIVKAFNAAQERAEKALMDMSDVMLADEDDDASS